jgi:hypothetical protein
MGARRLSVDGEPDAWGVTLVSENESEGQSPGARTQVQEWFAMGVEHILSQLEGALAAQLWHVAMLTAVTLPDVCAALEHGQTGKSRYSAWWEQWRDPSYADALPAADLYRYRCSLLHESKATSEKPSLKYGRIAYAPAGRPELHLTSYHALGTTGPSNLAMSLLVDADRFCRDMIASVRRWKPVADANPDVLRNAVFTVKFYENGMRGIAPFPMYG